METFLAEESFPITLEIMILPPSPQNKTDCYTWSMMNNLAVIKQQS